MSCGNNSTPWEKSDGLLLSNEFSTHRAPKLAAHLDCRPPPSLSIRGELICVGAHVLWNGKGQQFIYCLCFINRRRGSISICLYFVEWKLVVQFLYRAIELMFLGIMVGSWPLFAVCWNIILISMNRLMFLNRFLTPCMNRWFSSGYESTHGLPSQPMSRFSKATGDALNIWHTLV